MLALLAAAFVPAVRSMAEQWSSLDYASHGFLVPLVALWTATASRRRLADLPRKPSAIGLALGVAAVSTYAAALGANLVWLQGLALVAAVAACVLWLGGTAWLRTLAFPVAYLIFMVPLPPDWIAPVVVELQLWVSQAGVALLQAFGWPVLREGNVIQLPGDQSLFVAEACSGITSIVTLVPLAVLLAWLTERHPLRQALLVASVLPLALLGNLIRVVATVWAADAYGTAAATGGVFHESAGLLTYVLGCAALLGVGALMRRLWPQSDAAPAA